MYESFYNLHPTPFRLTPDPHFFFESDTHKRGLAYLRFAFYQEEGFVVITGAPGTGKTELMLNLISELPRHKVTLAKIVTSNLDADDLLDLVAASFLINPEHLSKGSLLKRLEDFFIHQAHNGKHVLLLIDEAHNLSVKSLIELSMLSNFQINEKPVMQCFLLGQDPLEEKLNVPELIHLKQRVLASTHLESLSQQETRDYINHRLNKSGWDNNPIIRDTAFALIHYYTKGVPRKINSLCNRVFLQSFLDDRHDIGADLVHQVIEELQEEILSKEPGIDLDFAEAQFPVEKSLILSSIDDTSKNINATYMNIDKESPDPPSQQERSARSPVSRTGNNSNVIAIPEFVKKREAIASQNTLTASVPASQVDAIDTNLEPNDVKPEATAENECDQDPVTTTDNSRDPKPDDLPQEAPSNGIEMKSPLRHPQMYKPVSKEQKNSRRSGLVDKELQALASLCETGTSTEKSDDNPKLSIKPQTSDSAPAKKIIIDDLAYENIEVNELETRPLVIAEKVTNEKRRRGWRPAVAAMATLVSVGLSIYWLSDSPTEIASNTGNPQSDNIVANNSVIDLLIPEVQTTLIEPAPESENASGTMLASLPDSLTGITAAEPFSAGESIFAIDSLSADAEDTTDTTQSNTAQLDKEMTQILEKPGIKSQADPNASDSQLTATQQPATQISIAAPVTPKAPPTTSEKPMAQVKPQATPSDPQPSAPATSLASNELNLVADAPPIVGTPITLDESITPNPGTENLPVNDTPANDWIQVGVRNEPSIAASQEDNLVISGSDLKSLLSTLARAYENGNLQKLVSTFATDIYSSDGSSREQMERDYRHLFNITDNRQLTIRDITWSQQDKQMLGSGDFQVRIREKGASKYTTYAGKISLAVVKESNNIVIRKLDYDYNN
jgi:general secretion pathway protein A